MFAFFVALKLDDGYLHFFPLGPMQHCNIKHLIDSHVLCGNSFSPSTKKNNHYQTTKKPEICL